MEWALPVHYSIFILLLGSAVGPFFFFIAGRIFFDAFERVAASVLRAQPRQTPEEQE